MAVAGLGLQTHWDSLEILKLIGSIIVLITLTITIFFPSNVLTLSIGN